MAETPTSQSTVPDNPAALWTGRIPVLADVFDARRQIRPYLDPTPAIRSEPLSELLGCNVIVKCESLLPTGAFKIRGGINLISRMTPEQLSRGIVAAQSSVRSGAGSRRGTSRWMAVSAIM